VLSKELYAQIHTWLLASLHPWLHQAGITGEPSSLEIFDSTGEGLEILDHQGGNPRGAIEGKRLEILYHFSVLRRINSGSSACVAPWLKRVSRLPDSLFVAYVKYYWTLIQDGLSHPSQFSRTFHNELEIFDHYLLSWCLERQAVIPADFFATVIEKYKYSESAWVNQGFALVVKNEGHPHLPQLVFTELTFQVLPELDWAQCQLNYLNKLVLNGLGLKTLPKLVQLRLASERPFHLELQHNEFSEFPSELCSTKLASLDLSYNRIRVFPGAIFYTLKMLNLSHNPLGDSKIVRRRKSKVTLTHLNLSYCELTQVPAILLQHPIEVELKGNQLQKH